MHRSTVILSICLFSATYAGADTLDAVFARIDAAAKTFKGMSADIVNIQHMALVDSDDKSIGTMKLLRVKPDETHMLVELKGPTGEQTLALDGHEGRVYYPQTKSVTVVDLSSRKSEINQFLMLGFGATSAELKSTYDVTYVNDEKIDGQQISLLRLIPKSAEMKRALKEADLWFGANGLVKQQKFLYPGGDYRTVTYSNMKPGGIADKDLELKLPKGVTIQKQ